ncbi:hypothetical protein [uncultured Prevotella sp.]|uniref:hypothetical protein n=1 Tax=uncultured Prevotella sp. TaxID=159272 RepID=UPI0025DE9CD3|nr:hypothetical protein [uncultured Prevotella sp.]
MKKRIRKKMIAGTHKKLPVKLYNAFLYQKGMLPLLVQIYRSYKTIKGVRIYATVTSHNEAEVHKKFKH